MKSQEIALLVLMIPLAAADSITNEGLRLRQANVFNARRCKSTPQYTEPVEYLRTPNFDVIFLNEDSSNPTWRKYANLYQPVDLNNAQRIEVSYESNTDGFRRSALSLNRLEVESVLATLGRKKHIIVLRPRNCHSHSVTVKDLMSAFKNEFLHKLLQQLHEKKQLKSEMWDPIISRILEVLDQGDNNMIDDLIQTFESPRVKPSRFPVFRNPTPITTPLDHTQHDDPCNERYVFMLQNQESSDPSALNNLLLRVLKVVTKPE